LQVTEINQAGKLSICILPERVNMVTDLTAMCIPLQRVNANYPIYPMAFYFFLPPSGVKIIGYNFL
jgi:hypothetical protein